MEQFHFVIKITKNFSQQYDYFHRVKRSVGQRKNTQNEQIIHRKVYYFK